MGTQHPEKNDNLLSKELDVDSLPIPPTAIEVMMENPQDCPIAEEDFQRVKDFFDQQVLYFEGLAQETNDPVAAERLHKWAARVPELYRIICANVRLITEEHFGVALESMKEKLDQFVGQDPFIVFCMAAIWMRQEHIAPTTLLKN